MKDKILAMILAIISTGILIIIGREFAYEIIHVVLVLLVIYYCCIIYQDILGLIRKYRKK